MALFAPYTSIDDMAGVLAPWFPTKLVLKHHFRNEEKFKNLKIPILLIHGDHDNMIPPEMSRRLEKAATDAKVTAVFVPSNHNDIFQAGKTEADAAMQQLISQINAK